MGHSISDVVIQFRFSCITISHEYQVSGKASNLWQQYSQKKILKKWDHQHLARILKQDKCAALPQADVDFSAGSSVLDKCQHVNCLMIHHSMWAFRAADPVRKLTWTNQHLHWTVDDWKHIAWSYFLVLVLFPIVLGRWTCTNIETTSWIHGPYMWTGDCSSWWSFCDGMGSLQLAWYGTVDMSDRWWYISILSDNLHSFMSILHSDDFNNSSKTICHTTRLKICYRVAPGTFL